jgi:FkbM family methyltransferase
VFTFEFVPSNLDILERNLALNPALRSQITVIPHPLWSDSTTRVQYTESGPGTRVGSGAPESAAASVETRSIDELVASGQIGRLDLLKLDIEGAELRALQGAAATIRQFRPRIAVSLYHSMDDMVQIPDWLRSLELGYRFYLGHYTRYAEETVLFAVPPER